MATPLGKKIHAARKKEQLSLDKLAELTDSSRSYIWELENKDGVNPTADKVLKIARALKIPVEFLLDNEQEELTVIDSSKVFFRRYEKLDPTKKAQIEAILDVLENDPRK
jgi:transcriptional regulator with XRE-family HTH domain